MSAQKPNPRLHRIMNKPFSYIPPPCHNRRHVSARPAPMSFPRPHTHLAQAAPQARLLCVWTRKHSGVSMRHWCEVREVCAEWACFAPTRQGRGLCGALFTSLPSPIIELRHASEPRPNPATYPPLGVSWRALLWRAAALRGRLTARQSDKPSFRKLPS